MFPDCIYCNNYLLFPLLFIESAGVIILTTGVSSKYLREPVIFKFVFISSRERGFKYFLFQLNCSIFFKSLWFKILRYCADFVFFAFPKPKPLYSYAYLMKRMPSQVLIIHMCFILVYVKRGEKIQTFLQIQTALVLLSSLKLKRRGSIITERGRRKNV